MKKFTLLVAMLTMYLTVSAQAVFVPGGTGEITEVPRNVADELKKLITEQNDRILKLEEENRAAREEIERLKQQNK